MNKPITPPDWKQWDPNMFLIVQDLQQYFEMYTAPVDEKTVKNTGDINDLGSRVTALEHNRPIGPGGDGAYLALGGTPSRYPTPTEMTDPDGNETSFLVIARDDGLYFYNPKTKAIIPPKSDGGTIAIQAQFPQIFQATHAATHNGRQGMSGVYTADTKDQDLDAVFTTHGTCIMLIVVNDAGEEYQTAIHPDGIASRIFRNGIFTANWTTIGGGSGAPVDPGVIKDITERLDALEAMPHGRAAFKDLTDTPDTYVGQKGKAVIVADTETDLKFVDVVTKDTYEAEVLYQRSVDKQHSDHIDRIDAVLTNNELRIDHAEKTLLGHADKMDEHGVRITAIELGGGGGGGSGSVDLTPVLRRLTDLESSQQLQDNRLDNIDMVNNDQDNTILDHSDQLMEHEDRLDLIEAKNTEQDDRLDVLESTPPSGGDVTKVALASGNVLPINAKGLGSEVFIGWDSLTIANSAKYENFIFWGTSTKRGLELPDIVDHNAEDIAANGVVRVGRTITITNRGTHPKFIKPMNGCTIWRNPGEAEGGQFDLPSGQAIVLTAWKDGANKRWVVVGSFDITDTSGAAVLKTSLMNGAQLVNWNTLGADPVSTSGNITAANMASTPFCVGMGAGTTSKFIMAEIVDRTVTTLTNTQVREGRTTYLVNMSTKDRTTELTGGCKFNMTGSNITTEQTVPAKSVWVFCPGIYSNGDKVWTFLGSFSSEAIDFKGLVDRVTALEALPPPAGVSNFLDLVDTPDDFIGHGEKLVVVKADESGLEFIEHGDITDFGSRIQDLEDGMAEHMLDFEAMGTGDIETSWNGLGAPSLSVLNDVTAENIATTPFVIAQGSVAGKKFTMPNIVAKDTKGLGATDVREGRTTYLINLGTVPRTVTLSAGCKFNMTGGAISTDQTIPRKTVWMFSPTLAAGDKVWTFIGTLSAETIDIKQLIDRLAALESSLANFGSGNNFVSLNAVGETVSGSSGNIDAAGVASTPFLVLPGATARNIDLPEIVAKDASPLTSTQVRQGRITFFGNVGSSTKTLVLGTNQKFYIDGTYIDTNITIPAGMVYMFTPALYGTQQAWTLIGSLTSKLEPTANLWNLYGPGVRSSNVIDSVVVSANNFTQNNVATIDHCVSRGAGGNRTMTLPEIIAATGDTIAGGTARSGRKLKISNQNTNAAGTVTVTGATDKVIRWSDGTTATSHVLQIGGHLDLVAVYDATGSYWMVCKEWNENDPGGKEKFTELTDTPSGYHPNKLVGYNLAGDALVPVDKTETFLQLTDTPTTYTGNARKVPMVRPDMSGMDFVDLPAGKQNFADLDDTPSGYQAGKLLAYNLSGTALIGVDKTFKSMTDTPNDYSGHKNKMLVLNNGETALEFKTIPDTSGLQGDIDDNYNSIIALQNADTILNNKVDGFNTGASNVTPNSLGIIVSGTSATITAEIVAATPYLMLPGTTSRDINLPQIVKTTSTTLSSSEVREGRLTYFGNLGSATKTMKLGANQKFFKDGAYFETNIPIPAGKIYMFIPAWFGTQQTWMFVAALNHHYNPAGLSVDTHEEDKVATLEARIAALEALIQKED